MNRETLLCDHVHIDQEVMFILLKKKGIVDQTCWSSAASGRNLWKETGSVPWHLSHNSNLLLTPGLLLPLNVRFPVSRLTWVKVRRVFKVFYIPLHPTIHSLPSDFNIHIQQRFLTIKITFFVHCCVTEAKHYMTFHISNMVHHVKKN